MAGRRALSQVSGDESETTEMVQCHSELDALKPFEEGLDSEYYPCILLEDATVYEKDGVTMTNLLNVEHGGPYIVRGKLAVDKDVSECLQHEKYQGTYIEINNCQGFSIGIDPIVLWALGRSGWLEIRPSREYTQMYAHMKEGINIYFFLTVLYEGRKQKKSLSMDQILLQYGKHDGTGMVKAEVGQIFKNHAEFLLSQMGRVESSVNWKNTLAYSWLKSVKPDVHQRIPKQKPEGISETTSKVMTSTPGSVQVHRIHISDPAKFHEDAKPKSITEERRLRHSLKPIQSQEAQHRGGSGSLTSSGVPNTVEVILQVIEQEYDKRQKLTLAKLGTTIYLRFSFKNYSVGQAIVKIWAREIIAALNEDWYETPVYQSLKRHVELNEITEHHDEAAATILRPRAKKSDATDRSGQTTIQDTRAQEITSRTRSSELRKPTETTPPRSAGKSISHSFTGQRSGKEAVLRLVSSSIKRSNLSADDSSEDEQHSNFGQRKRRRASSEDEIGEQELDGEDPDDDDREMKVNTKGSFDMVSELLPTLEPRGPNGTWFCQTEGCTYIVRNALEDDGREEIRKHFLEHADTTAKEDLVLKEARPHLPVNHLLEKLRSLGEIASTNDDEETPSINGVQVPRPIKRHGMIL
ncbi:defective in methylation-7 protein [Phlyctema vagabunda]|uniref:Defective in methylation-7 protein n=1 Tax=Phlyctema vagabunda TaxID=108571 RepID=A0ABR4PJB6_9HELO